MKEIVVKVSERAFLELKRKEVKQTIQGSYLLWVIIEGINTGEKVVRIEIDQIGLKLRNF